MTCIHHCNITSVLSLPYKSCVLPIHPSLPSPGNLSSFHCLHNFVFSRMSRSWNSALNCSLGFVAWRGSSELQQLYEEGILFPISHPTVKVRSLWDHRASESDSRSSDPLPQGLQVWRGEGSDDGDSLLSCLQGFSHVNLSYFKGKMYFKEAVFLLHLFPARKLIFHLLWISL